MAEITTDLVGSWIMLSHLGPNSEGSIATGGFFESMTLGSLMEVWGVKSIKLIIT